MTHSFSQSSQLFDRAQQSIPGGVNSPVRAFRSVGGTPLFIQRAEGAYMWDEDGNRYIDYINSWGPMILGHAHAAVTAAIQDQLSRSVSYGAPTRLETEMAELIRSMAPGIDLIRMVNSGTEACMSALRLARGYTGKNKVIKFEGCYHGHADSFLVQAGSGVATLGIQHVPGVTQAVAADTITLPFNDITRLNQIIELYKNEIAAIIVEPVPGNMGCVPALPGYLQHLRSICTREQIVLIFDEVMTGFRLAAGGAQAYYGIEADLVTYGKIIGGGLPVGAYGGKKHIMEQVAPLGKVYQAGTLSGNPLAMRAGFALLSQLHRQPEIYTQLEAKTKLLAQGIEKIFNDASLPAVVNRTGSMMSVHFSSTPILNFSDAAAANNELFKRYFHHCLQQGIYLPPSPFETWFISTAISDADIEKTLEATHRFTKLA